MSKTKWLLFLTVVFLGMAPEIMTEAGTAMNDFKQVAYAEPWESETKELSVIQTEDIWTSVYRNIRYETKISGEMIATMALAEVKSKDVELMSSSTDHIVSYHGKRFAITDDDYQILLRIVEAEASTEDIKGKMLVANVVLNRMEIGFGGDTVSEVVFDKGQFQPVRNGRIFKVTVSEETIEAVERVISGEDYSKGALYFMARDKASKRGVKWFDEELKFLFEHGGHEFYTEK